MQDESLFRHTRVGPRVLAVHDPSEIELTDSELAAELFIEPSKDRFLHVFRFVLETELLGGVQCTEGILVGQSVTPDRPSPDDWSGLSENLSLLSYIWLGETTSLTATSGHISGQINEDPIIFVNFDPSTATARHVTALDTVPVRVRERHLRFLQEPAAAV